MQYVLFHRDISLSTHKTKRGAMDAANRAMGYGTLAEQLTVGAVDITNVIHRMWAVDGRELEFESHGGDHGAWK